MFPIQVSYYTTMYIIIAVCIIAVIVMEELTPPDKREKGLWRKVILTAAAVTIAFMAHGILFAILGACGVVECTNYHPKDYAHVKQMSKSELATFYANNGLKANGNPR